MADEIKINVSKNPETSKFTTYLSSFFGLAGSIAGLYIAHKNKMGAWSYIWRFFLFGAVGQMAGQFIAGIVEPVVMPGAKNNQSSPKQEKTDGTTSTKASLTKIPAVDDVWPLISNFSSTQGKTLTGAQKAAFAQEFSKLSDLQKRFLLDYVKSFIEIKSLPSNSKAWNDAFDKAQANNKKNYYPYLSEAQRVQVISLFA